MDEGEKGPEDGSFDGAPALGDEKWWWWWWGCKHRIVGVLYLPTLSSAYVLYLIYTYIYYTHATDLGNHHIYIYTLYTYIHVLPTSTITIYMHVHVHTLYPPRQSSYIYTHIYTRSTHLGNDLPLRAEPLPNGPEDGEEGAEDRCSAYVCIWVGGWVGE